MTQHNVWLRWTVCGLMLWLTVGCHPKRPRLSQPQEDAIQTLVNAEIAQGSFPGAVVLIGHGKRVLFEEAFGHQAIEPDKQPMQVDSIFDLASLTKPLATAASIMVLMDQSKIDPNDTVATYLPAFACEGKDDVQIRHLLTHTSGLPPYTNAKALKDAHGSPCPEAVIETICLSKPLNKPGEKFRYSCLGYILLGRIVEQVSGQGLDQFSREHLFGPLGMKHTTYRPPDEWKDRVASTEIIDGHALCGTVHDPLAQLMDGVSGNAGLYATARDMARYCQMLLNHGQCRGETILSSEAVNVMTTPQRLGRAQGFDVSSSYAWLKGDYASEQSFCHSGYTGTSVVCDPKTNQYVIILTNRAHPHDKGTVKAVRTGIANIVFGE